MEGKIRGSFPGGPRKSVPATQRTAPPKLESVQEFEERRARSRVRRTHKARARRMLYGLVVSAALSGGVGVLLGVRSHTTVEQVREQDTVERATTAQDELNRQVNRTLVELWNMEDVQVDRNTR
jgi:hypothetical protein